MTTGDDELRIAAEGFAHELNDLVTGVFPGAPRAFTAHVRPSDAGPSQAWVASFHRGDGPPNTEPVTLHVGGEPRMHLMVDFKLAWDGQGTYLKVRKSSFAVTVVGQSEPLWRYDYVSEPHWKPHSYLHVHAHRDEVVQLVLEGRRAHSPGERPPKPLRSALSLVHFPTGGERFRPCLEDVIDMLVSEFSVDTQDRWRDAVDHGRARWQRTQLAAAVRDDPATAAEILRRLGYRVEARSM